jgi:hypothetical protein
MKSLLRVHAFLSQNPTISFPERQSHNTKAKNHAQMMLIESTALGFNA